MSVPAILAAFLAEVPTRVQRAADALDALPEIGASGADAWCAQLAQVAHDIKFVQDLDAIIPLFSQDIIVPRVEALEQQFQAAGAQAFAWQQQNASTRHPWIERFSAPPPSPKLPAAFQQFLQDTSFSHQGFDLSLAELWHLAQAAPDAITPELMQDFEAGSGVISSAFAGCLNAVFADDDPLLTRVLATPLALSPADTAKLMQVTLPKPKPDTPQPLVFKTPQDMCDAAFSVLCQSNVSGAECRDIVAAGHVIVSTTGPDFPFTIQPDPTLPPLIYVPFTGQAKDVILLCHQLGHGLHLWRAARGSQAPVALSPALDEIIPAYFEAKAAEIISQVSDQASQNACEARHEMWQKSVRKYQETAQLIVKASQGALGAHDFADLRHTSLYALIFQAGVFPNLPLSSFAWGHIMAAEFQEQGGGEAALFAQFV